MSKSWEILESKESRKSRKSRHNQETVIIMEFWKKQEIQDKQKSGELKISEFRHQSLIRCINRNLNSTSKRSRSRRSARNSTRNRTSMRNGNRMVLYVI